MKFKKNAPSILITMVIISVITISYLANKISTGIVTASEENQFNVMANIIRSTLRNTEDRAVARCEIISSIPEVKEAFAIRDREKLLTVTRDIYRIQSEKYGINQAQFHEPPATSFLRLNKPKIYGDDISNFRQMVVEVNRNLVIRKGVNVTRTGPAVMGVVPMTDAEGKHTGSFEMGSNFDSMFDDLKTSYGFELGLFVDEKLLRDVMDFGNGEIFSDQNRVGKYLITYSTHNELLRKLITEKEIGINEDTHYLRDAASLPYGVLLLPLYDHASKQIGVIAMAKDFSLTRASAKQAIIWQAFLALSAIVILSGIIIIVIRGLLLQPLGLISDRLAELTTANECPRPIVDQEFLCEELQKLLDSYERLRKIRRRTEKK